MMKYWLITQLIYYTQSSIFNISPTSDYQTITQKSDGIYGINEKDDRFGLSLASGYLNDDKYMDLAIGVPGEDLKINDEQYNDAGRVVVIFGSSSGLDTSTSLSLDQSTAGFSGKVEKDDRFGWSVSIGHGNFGDSEVGFLAIGSPGEDLTINGKDYYDAGYVHVVKFIGDSMVNSDDVLGINSNSIETGGISVQEGMEFGHSLEFGSVSTHYAWYENFQLTVGIPGASDTRGGDNSGAVMIVQPVVNLSGIGSSINGIVYSAGDIIDPKSFQTTGSIAEGARLGTSLTWLDFNKDNVADLAVGSPNYSQDTGRVDILLGSNDDLLDGYAQFELFRQDIPVLHITEQTFHRTVTTGSPVKFGTSLSTTDTNDDGYYDLLIGSPKSTDGKINTGRVYLLEGMEILSYSSQIFSPSTMPSYSWLNESFFTDHDRTNQNDQFGLSLP